MTRSTEAMRGWAWNTAFDREDANPFGHTGKVITENFPDCLSCDQ